MQWMELLEWISLGPNKKQNKTRQCRKEILLTSIINNNYARIPPKTNPVKQALILSAYLLAFAPTAKAENPMTDLMSISGTCENITLYGRHEERKCKGAMNILYKDGRSGFYFVGDNMILTFSGDGDQQVRKGANNSTQSIDLVLLNNPQTGDPDKPEKLLAIGKCSFENPFLGKPTLLQCSATTERGEFEATFMHDGSEPVILIKDGKPVR